MLLSLSVYEMIDKSININKMFQNTKSKTELVLSNNNYILRNGRSVFLLIF